MSDDNATNPYEAVLADLRARKQEIEVAIAAISRLAGIDEVDAAPTSTTPRRTREAQIEPDSFFNMTTQDAIKKCLHLSKKTLPAAEITRRLEKGGIIHDAKNFYNSVYTALRRLKRSNEVVQLENKDWGLAAWYPNKPRQKKRDEPKGAEQAESDADSQAENGDGQDDTDEDVSLKAL